MSVNFLDAFNYLKNYLYSENTDFPEEYLKVLPENTLVTLLHKNQHAIKIINEYLNQHNTNISKIDLINFLRHIIKYFCIPSNQIQPLYKKYQGKRLDLKDWKFIKDYEIPLVVNYLPENPKDIKKNLKKSRRTSMNFNYVIKKFQNIKNIRKECFTCSLKSGTLVLFDTNYKQDITQTNLLFVFEAPGEQEALKGIPIIGKSGQLVRPYINKYFSDLKWFVTNTCLCRPENNRTPTTEDKISCASNLDEIISITDPDYIVAFGGTAMDRFNIRPEKNQGITSLRGKIQNYKCSQNNKEYKVFCTVHPSYVLRSHNEKIYEEDFSKLRGLIKPQTNIGVPGKIHSIKLPKNYYNYPLIDIQSTGNNIVYIFDDNGNKMFYKMKRDEQQYFFYTNKENDDFLKHVEDTVLVKKSPSQFPGTTCYEGDIESAIRHSIDYYYNLDHKNESYNPNITYIDIEVATKNKIFPDPELVEWPISLISCKNNNGQKVTFTIKQIPEKEIEGYKIVYCKDEKELIQKTFKFFEDTNTHIITAWNISFDIGYIINRYEKKLRLSSKKLSPLKERAIIDFERYNFKIPGYIIFDLLSGYRSITYGDRESYSLDSIAELELGEKKLEKGIEFGKIFESDPIRAIKYNIDDVNKIEKLDKKLDILNYFNELRNIASIPWKDVLVTSKIVEGNLLSFAKKSGIVLRNKYDHIPNKFMKVGAYVKTPIPGRHDPIYLVDFKSLYPSIMMTYNIGPDSYVARLENYWKDFVDYILDVEKDYEIILNPHLVPEKTIMKLQELKSFLKDKIVTPYGTIFKEHGENTTSLSYKVLDYLLKQRAYHRKLIKEDPSNDNKQRSYKEIANSNYGYYGFEGSRLYNTDLVNSITISGQFLIKMSAYVAHNLIHKNDFGDLKQLTKKILIDEIKTEPHPKKKDKLVIIGQDIDIEDAIYTDTDSIYFKTGNNPKEAKERGDKIFGIINTQLFKEKLVPFFNLEKEKVHLLLEFEDLCRGYWPGEKKRYCYIPYDLETYKPKLGKVKIEIKGLETQRSDYPRQTREKLKELIKLTLQSKDNIIPDLEEKLKKELIYFTQKLETFDTTICKPVSFSTKQYKKVPSHVIGMKLWNILNDREDFRPGTKGYQYYIDFNLENIPNKKLKDKISQMLYECKFKGNISNIVIPEDYPINEIQEFFEKWEKGALGYVLKINKEKMIDFIWIQRCINLLKGIADFSYVFGRKTKNTKQQIPIFDF